jgi:hypothetical protein
MAAVGTTLSKFGVPIGGVNQGILHPKQKYRFRVLWYGFGDNTGLREMTANVMTCTRPKPSFEEIKLDSYNSVAWIQGKHSFDTIEIKLRDDITNSVISTIGTQVQKQMNHYEQTSAVAGINYKFSMEIHSLDGTTNEELESWVLDGCWLTAAAYSDSDYSSGDVQEVTLTIRFDNATNQAGLNTNNGTTVGGDPYPNIPSPTGGTTFA